MKTATLNLGMCFFGTLFMGFFLVFQMVVGLTQNRKEGSPQDVQKLVDITALFTILSILTNPINLLNAYKTVKTIFTLEENDLKNPSDLFGNFSKTLFPTLTLHRKQLDVFLASKNVISKNAFFTKSSEVAENKNIKAFVDEFGTPVFTRTQALQDFLNKNSTTKVSVKELQKYHFLEADLNRISLLALDLKWMYPAHRSPGSPGVFIDHANNQISTQYMTIHAPIKHLKAKKMVYIQLPLSQGLPGNPNLLAFVIFPESPQVELPKVESIWKPTDFYDVTGRSPSPLKLQMPAFLLDQDFELTQPSISNELLSVINANKTFNFEVISLSRQVNVKMHQKIRICLDEATIASPVTPPSSGSETSESIIVNRSFYYVLVESTNAAPISINHVRSVLPGVDRCAKEKIDNNHIWTDAFTFKSQATAFKTSSLTWMVPLLLSIMAQFTDL